MLEAAVWVAPRAGARDGCGAHLEGQRRPRNGTAVGKDVGREGARKNEGNNPMHSQVLSANAQVGHARWHHQRSLRRESADPPRSEDINNVLAAVTGIGAGDEIEGMLATQMIATHMDAMKALRLLKASETVPQQDSNGNLAIPRC